MSAAHEALHPASRVLLGRHQRDMVQLARWAIGFLLLGLVPGVMGLALAPLASAVVAPGVVMVDLQQRQIQHAEGGLVTEVHVRDGQQVREGDTLLVLGNVAVAAELDRLQLRVAAEEAALARLQAEQAALPAVLFPPALRQAASADERLRLLLNQEQGLFQSRREARQSQRGLLQAQLLKIGDELQALLAQIQEAERSLGHQRESLDTQQALLAQGYVSPARMTQLQSGLADYGVKLAERKAERARAEQRRIDAELRLRELDSGFLEQVGQQLAQGTQRLAELRQALRSPSDAAARQVVTAPVAGTVMNLRVTSAGRVIAPRETLASIVPAAARLLVETTLAPEDIERVHLGQSADVRFTAFNARTTPPVQGRVTYVSPDRVPATPTAAAHFVVQVDIEPPALQQLQGRGLQAGMPAEVFLLGRERSPLAYLLEPLSDVLRRGARER